jgi:hypothetical protein
MILGMSTFTLVHVALSLIGIFSGFVVLFGLLTAKRLDGWTALFLTATVLTSVTGFLFPFHGITPGIVVGCISIVVLAIAILARYALRLAGPWRPIYVVTAMLAEYLNVFVLVVQLFDKVPALKAFDPTKSGPPFKATQGIVLVLFIALIIAAAIKFRPEPARTA